MRWLTVRRLEREDLATRVEWFNAPAVCNQMTIHPPLSLANTNQWFTNNILSDSRRDFTFLLQEQGDDDLVAMGGLVDIDNWHRRAELYIVVNPRMTAQGIGRQSIQWLCNFGFIQLNLSRIYLCTLEDNDGARRLYGRLGFVREGRLRKHIYHNGTLVDRYVQGLLKEEWKETPWHASPPLSLRTPWQEEYEA